MELLNIIAKYRRGKTTIREELHVGYVVITNVVLEKVLSFMNTTLSKEWGVLDAATLRPHPKKLIKCVYRY